MKVKKRGERGFERLHLDKITTRLTKLCYGLSDIVDPDMITQETVRQLYDGITTSEIDEISARCAENKKTLHPDYGILAARISVSNIHKNTPKLFSISCKLVYELIPSAMADKYYNFINKNSDVLDSMIIEDNDYLFDYFGIKTMESKYLLKVKNDKHKINEEYRLLDRPQYLYMRVAIAIHFKENFNIDDNSNKNDLFSNIKKTYKLLANKYYIHGSPTLFNGCAVNMQMLSCFLLGTKDSIEDIMDNLKNASIISKWAGGIGIGMSNIRSKGSYIKGTNGESKGLISQLKMFDDASDCWDQGGRRKGSMAIYLEPWHGDILEFLELKLHTGNEKLRARNLFYALWVPDLFMTRFDAKRKNPKADIKWSLFSPSTAPGLDDVYGDDFNRLYEQYEKEGRAIKTVDIEVITKAIFKSQRETGMPYITYKDHVNHKSNQMNIGVIKNSNLCAEIVEYSRHDSYACCTLASICLHKFVKKSMKIINSDIDTLIQYYDWNKLHDTAYAVCINLNHIVDVNSYPLKETQSNNFAYRPIAIGVQGLADVFGMFRIGFTSDQARRLNKLIFETIYHGALCASVDLAKQFGPYSAFDGSPFSKGLFQFNLWGVPVDSDEEKSFMWDWAKLRNDVIKYGTRNSLLTSAMPTATTSQINGSNECFEPYTRNIYTRKTLSGTFIIQNKHMVDHLMELGLWNDHMKNQILDAEGSIANIDSIPNDIKNLYKTAYELRQRDLIDMSADRGLFIDQTQSLNLYIKNSDDRSLAIAMLYGWSKGLKTGSYYIHTQKASDTTISTNVSIMREKLVKSESSNPLRQIIVEKSDNKSNINKHSDVKDEILSCKRDNPDCDSCGG